MVAARRNIEISRSSSRFVSAPSYLIQIMKGTTSDRPHVKVV